MQSQKSLEADARSIVTHPERYAHCPMIRRLAWAALLSARGLRANQFRLIAMQREAEMAQ